jgi:23S rRNA pseudouridine1911/1915/1917 synthase
VKRTIKVAEGAADKRLDVYLAANLKITRNKTQKLIEDSVTINGARVRPSYLLSQSDIIEVIEQAPADKAAIEPPKLDIVYEDDDILVVNKPPDLAVHAGNGRPGEPTLADFARLHTSDPDPERPGIVHRLDRDTSGLLVIAKTEAAKKYMQEQFASRTIKKTYTLLTIGTVSPAEAVIRLPLDRDKAHPTKRAVVSSGREAITGYIVLENYPGYTLVKASPQTGRTHQIRVHFAALGHPVAGDAVYGQTKRPLGLPRHFLHASSLVFKTPSGTEVSLESPLPPDLQQFLNKLRGQV